MSSNSTSIVPYKHTNCPIYCDQPQYYRCRKYQLCKYQEGKQYRYVQPEIPKNYRPMESYRRPTKILDCNTVQKLSYLPVRLEKKVEKFIPQTNLKVSDQPMNSNTVQKMSFPKWTNAEKSKPIKPMSRSLLGVGKFSSDTVYRASYPWTKIKIPTAFRPKSELCLSRQPIDTNTVHQMSFLPPDYSQLEKMQQVRHKSELCFPDVKMDLETVNKLSYMPHEGDFRREPCKPSIDHQFFDNSQTGTNSMKTVCRESYQLPGYFEEVPNDQGCCCMCYCTPIKEPKVNNSNQFIDCL